MNYKLLSTNEEGKNFYVRIDDDGIIRISCGEDHPPFQEWLAEGNEPLPADEPS